LKTFFLQTAFLALFLSINAFAQNDIKIQEKYTAHNKGKFTIAWGGNREKFTKSDIHFVGNDYDFTLYDVNAHDKPKGWHIDYITPGQMTVPQTNFNIGYYINDHYMISVGEDHMKYVMTQDQVARIGGAISSNYPDYAGIYTNNGANTIDLTDGKFLKFEHTNGLNYVYTAIARVDDLSKYLGITNTDKVQINLTEGIGIGFLLPRTDATLLGKQRHDEFHVAGFGLDARAGLNFTFFKYFFMQTDLKGGYIDMPDIQTTVSSSDSASQHFFFVETIVSFGGIFRL
jgi:hypothetical protein